MYGPNLVHDLPPYDEQRNLRVVVETPRGANIKIKFDEKLGFFCLSRVLPLGVTYPYDFGFVPQTLAQDGDPIDAVVLIDAMTYPGVVISCRLLGALQVEERGLRGRPNHRLVAVPVKAARRDDWRNFSDLGKRMQQELERFFVMSSAFTSKDPVVRGWVGPDAANDMVLRAGNRYRERMPPRPSVQAMREGQPPLPQHIQGQPGQLGPPPGQLPSQISGQRPGSDASPASASSANSQPESTNGQADSDKSETA